MAGETGQSSGTKAEGETGEKSAEAGGSQVSSEPIHAEGRREKGPNHDQIGTGYGSESGFQGDEEESLRKAQRVKRKADSQRIKDRVGLERIGMKLRERLVDPPVVPDVHPRVTTVFAHMVRVEMPGERIGE
jgi:hypothetical protein